MPIVKGPWEAPSHLREHQAMFDSLVKLLSDLDNSSNPEVNPGSILPRNLDGSVQWSGISVEFLIQWTMLNSAKVSHKHLEIKDADASTPPV